MNHENLQNEYLFPIGVVKDLTGLTARQIRYYEEHGLVQPNRNDGNRRIYSLKDIIRCLEIKKFIEEGVNIPGIKAVYESKHQSSDSVSTQTAATLSEQEFLRLLKKVEQRLNGI